MNLARQLQRLAVQYGERYIPDHEASWWLRTRLVDLDTRDRAAQIAHCEHLRGGGPSFAALWAPDRIVCVHCVPELRLTGDADRTCDRCGAIATGVHPVVVAASETLLVSFGLCRFCFRREMGR